MPAFDHDRKPHFVNSMANSIPFAPLGHCVPSSYYPPQHINHGLVHVEPPPIRTTTQQRKRPKYTRSKTGCLTCRVKKIKCDETKPNCMRCTHGQRECTWPEGVPARKKTIPRKESPNALEGRPSTASSSASSTPPTRDPTPPRCIKSEDLGLLPLTSRRTSDSYLQLRPLPAESDPTRRPYLNNNCSPLYLQTTTSNVSNNLNMIPDMTYRYDQFPYPNTSYTLQSPRPVMSTSMRPMGHHQNINQWSTTETMDSYFPSLTDRSLMAHAPGNDSHTRY